MTTLKTTTLDKNTQSDLGAEMTWKQRREEGQQRREQFFTATQDMAAVISAIAERFAGVVGRVSVNYFL